MGDHMTSSNDHVRIGVIGTGAMGAAHVGNLSRWVPGARVSQIFDVDSERAKTIADQVGAVPRHRPADALITSDEVDAVLIAAPDPLHEPLALACLASLGKPTLLEKPIATSLDGSSRRVVDAEVAGGRRLIQLGFMRHFDPAYVALREAVLNGSIGIVRAAHCLHRNAHSHPSHTDEGLLVNSMIHEFDRRAVDARRPDLAAVTVFVPRLPDGALKDLQVGVSSRQRAAPVVTIEVFLNAQYGYDVHTEVTGTRGTVSLLPPYGVSVRRDGVDGRVVGSDGTLRFEDAYRIEVNSWVQRDPGRSRSPAPPRGTATWPTWRPSRPSSHSCHGAAGWRCPSSRGRRSTTRPDASRGSRSECTGLCTARVLPVHSPPGSCTPSAQIRARAWGNPQMCCGRSARPPTVTA